MSRDTTTRSEWDDEINDEAVRVRLELLSGDGMSFHCYSCNSTAKPWHPCSADSCLGEVGRTRDNKHKKQLDATLWNMRREKQRIANGKHPEKAIKMHSQSAMMGFFAPPFNINNSVSIYHISVYCITHVD